MKDKKRALLFLTSFLAAAAMFAVPAMAGSRKKISSVNIAIESEIQPEMRFGEEMVEVTVRGGHYSFDSYEINNVGFEWSDEDVPELTIYLHADDNYYFSLTKASSVKLSGATYVRASKQDSSETLCLVVQLPSLQESVADQGEVILTENGYALWDAVRGAGSYELRLYRNGEGVGVSMLTTQALDYDFRTMMSRPGTYFVKVRPVNAVNAESKGKWAESGQVTISKEQANRIRLGEAGGMPQRGQWKQDDRGSWYQFSDGTYVKNNWQEIDGEWYFFDEEGYMKTGWIEWNGTRYYCGNSGAMLKDTTTPDGVILDHTGKPKTD